MSDFLTNLSRRRKSRPSAGRAPDGAPVGTVADITCAPEEQQPESLAKVRAQLLQIFDVNYYLGAYPDVSRIDGAPFDHYFYTGIYEGRKPNRYFDPVWYLDNYPDVRIDGMSPAIHYVLHGDLEGRKPSAWFDPNWYRSVYGLREDQVALAHYLSNLLSYTVNPIGEFDAEYYVTRYPDIRAAGIDAFQHYMEAGYREGRNPSPLLDMVFYSRRYLRDRPDDNPLVHYIQHKHEAGVHGRPDEHVSIATEVKYFTNPGPSFEPPRPVPLTARRRAKVLAYYLPQFHAIPENDQWWGTGFTEWTNLARSLPRFKGHYQPRVPRDLGFYSLETIDTLRQQWALAKSAGLHGFIYYYYWFNGRRLLSKPLENLLQCPEIDLNFALMWANENWTRQWDGHADQVLISQSYREQDEALLIADFARHFQDPRYIRVAGRPLLMIYRPALIPHTRAAVGRWREIFAKQYGEDPLFITAQAFETQDPTGIAFDGAVEFPPHKICQDMSGIENTLDWLDPSFTGRVLDYNEVIKRSLDNARPQFPLIRSVMPNWDNDPRRQGAGTVIHGSTPTAYEAWLSAIIAQANEYPFFGEPFVCINAWNEWAEGTYLEPDQHYGAAYLNATARAICPMGASGRAHRMLLVGHDANPHGAQELLLNIATTLQRRHGVVVSFLLLNDGPLLNKYREIADVAVGTTEDRIIDTLRRHRQNGVSAALVNTTVSARIVRLAVQQGITCTTLVHELPRFIQERGLHKEIEAAARYSERVVFPAASVRDDILKIISDEPRAEIVIQPQGTYKTIDYSESVANDTRKSMGLDTKSRLVLGAGFADLRKGFDLFLQVWRLAHRMSSLIHFAWVGDREIGLESWLSSELDIAIATGTFHLIDRTSNIGNYYCAADLFALTSREDPFPSVVLEAISAGVPTVAFDRAGGIPDMLLRYNLGAVARYGDIVSMAQTAIDIVESDRPSALERKQRHDLVEQHFSWQNYISILLHYAFPLLADVMVVVPNYNYADYLPARLSSIFSQTLPVAEVVVLDDCSSDNSLEVLQQIQHDYKRELTVITNTENSGSVFLQWKKAASIGKTEYIWIAEADDDADPKLLEELTDALKQEPTACFGFCDSRIMDGTGQLSEHTYKHYYSTIEPGALSVPEVFDGQSFLARLLSVKNCILNVSAVVWRREALRAALDASGTDLFNYRMAGDWRLYIEALSAPGATVVYKSDPLNVHRRHSSSVTHTLNADLHVAEIERIHRLVRERASITAEIVEKQHAYITDVNSQLTTSDRKPRQRVRRSRH